MKDNFCGVVDQHEDEHTVRSHSVNTDGENLAKRVIHQIRNRCHHARMARQSAL